MRRVRESWAAMLGWLILETIVASCAGSEDPVGAREDDAGGSSTANDAAGDESDGGCEGVSDACATQELTCREAEWCPTETNHDTRRGFSSVWGSGKDDVWVVGAAGSAIHWDGSAWTSVAVETDQSLYAVWGSGPNDVWTVSSLRTIFHTTGFAQSGTPWSLVSVGAADGMLRTIWGTSPSDLWVGGRGLAGGVFRPPSDPLADGGLAWAQTIPSRFTINAIWGSGPEDIWAVGPNGIPPHDFGGSRALHTTGVAAADGGVPVWTEFDTRSFAVLYAVWGSGPGDVWAVGGNGTIRHFTAGAEQWSVMDSPTTENLRGLWGAGPDDIWAVGDHGTLLHYDGTAWRTSTGAFSPGEKPNLYGVWGSGPSDVWAVGSGVVLHFSGPKPDAQGAAQ